MGLSCKFWECVWCVIGCAKQNAKRGKQITHCLQLNVFHRSWAGTEAPCLASLRTSSSPRIQPSGWIHPRTVLKYIACRASVTTSVANAKRWFTTSFSKEGVGMLCSGCTSAVAERQQ